MVNDQEETNVECVTDEAAGEVKNNESTADAASNANGKSASNDEEASAELLEKIKSQVEVLPSIRYTGLCRVSEKSFMPFSFFSAVLLWKCKPAQGQVSY